MLSPQQGAYILLHRSCSQQLPLSTFTCPGPLVWLQLPFLVPGSSTPPNILHGNARVIFKVQLSSSTPLFESLLHIWHILWLDIQGFSWHHPSFPALSCISIRLQPNGVLLFAWTHLELPCFPMFAYLIFLLQSSTLHPSMLRSFPCLVYPPQSDASTPFFGNSQIPFLTARFLFHLRQYQYHSKAGSTGVF